MGKAAVRGSSGARFFILCAGLFASTALFGVPGRYSTAIFAVSAMIFLTTFAAAWSFAHQALASGERSLRAYAIAGLLLAAPFALFAWLPGYGPPDMATDSQNEKRYLALLAGSLLVAAGFVMLARARASDANGRLWSNLGLAAALLAAPLYAVFCAVQISIHSARASGGLESSSGTEGSISLVLLFFGAALGYLATACFARALHSAGWIGRTATILVSVVSVLALSSLVAAKALSPTWFELPLFLAAIPAVPWIMPCLLGLALVRRTAKAAPMQQPASPDP